MSKDPPSAEIPQPRVRPLVGNAPDLDPETPAQSMMRLAKELGPIYRLSFPTRSLLVISSHELVADACDEGRFEKHISGPLEHIRDFTGDGLFTAYANEPNWAMAHRLLMPAFGPAAMKSYFEDMLDIADQMLTKWERLGPEETLDVPDNMTRLTLDTIALCGFAYRFNSFYKQEMHPFVEAMVRGLAEAGRRSKRMPVQTQLMFLSQRQYDADTKYMHHITDELIAKRKQVPTDEAPRDLLGLMLSGKDAVTGQSLSDDNIRNQLVTFLIAGHETTSGLLSFATHLMLQNPDILKRAQTEVDQLLGDETPQFEHISKLSFIDQTLRETLRLYPTAPAFSVKARHDTELGGRYKMKKGDVAMILTPALHRDPKVWKDPERFDPTRFGPKNRDSIPSKAWLPFGNGARACIGRAFALQEANLVLAMMLQRFEIWQPAPYDLVVKETLTLKPDGLYIRARVRKHVKRRSETRPVQRPVAEAAGKEAAVPSHNTPLLALYGSNSGASEAFARRIASDGVARGYAAKVAPLDDYAGRLPKDGASVLVTASYNGQAPDNAKKFCSWLDGAPAGSLIGVRYTVFGCGNRDWAGTYQMVPKMVDDRMRDSGAQTLLPRGEGDARGDFFGDFEQWYGPFWDTLGQTLGVSARELTKGPLYEVEVVPSSAAELVKQNKLELATLVESRELVDLSSPIGRSKRHFAFALPEGLSYAAGDYLAILPENDPGAVERASRRFGLRADAAVVLRSTRGAMAASLPTERPVSVHELLGRHVELSAPATRRDLEQLASYNVCPPHRDHLTALSTDPQRYRSEILEKRVSVLDLLDQYQSCELSFAQFLELLPAMRVRQYSISSSPHQDPTQCTLTVAVVDAPAWSGIGHFRGTCSGYLARLSKGDKIPVAVRTPKNPFHPPALNEKPIIMACAGTGLAPFRGFIQERALRHDKGERAGEALLFFGCDHPDVDYLYKDQLDAWTKAGICKVFPAFYKKPDGEVAFVQHRLWQERDRVWDLMEQGANFFICGDGQRMAPAVRATLAKIRSEKAGSSLEDAAKWVDTLEQEGRYVADVFA